jgi:hemerythrin superfamily protein
MNAIKLLEQQHREVEKLFEKFERAGDRAKQTRHRLCQEISNALAIHANIEETIFYPATKSARTEELLHEAVEEHLAAKRIIADLVEKDPEGETLDAKMAVLKEQVLHHIGEEEDDLFPRVKKQLEQDRLEQLGEEMAKLAARLEEEGEARIDVPGQTDSAAPI